MGALGDPRALSLREMKRNVPFATCGLDERSRSPAEAGGQSEKVKKPWQSKHRIVCTCDRTKSPRNGTTCAPTCPSRPSPCASQTAPSQPRRHRARVLRRAREAGARRRDRPTSTSRGGSRDVQGLPSLAVVPRLQPRTRAEHARQDLLQVRRQQHLGLAQAQLGHRASLLRQSPRARQDHHRDGRRAMGHRARRGSRTLRRRPRRVHGEVLLRAEAAPPLHHEHLRRHGDALPSDTTAIGRKMLAENPASTGSLGTAISEAVERALNVPGTRGATSSAAC